MRFRRGAGALAALGALALTVALLPGTAAAQQEADVTSDRVAGTDRYATAAAIATATFEQAGTAVLASGEQFPDALVAAFAAGAVDGPVLLTRSDALPEATADALDALGVDTVVVVGGPSAVSPDVLQAAEDAGYATERVSGQDRYATATAVAERFADADGSGTLDGRRTALLASGERFPDALAAGPLAAGAGLPLLLTPPGTTDPAVPAALEQLDVEQLVVIGGRDAVSDEVVASYQTEGVDVERWAGRDRVDTALTVATNAVERLEGFSAATVLLARGDAFADALAAGPHAGALGAPVLLTASPDVLPGSTDRWLFEACPDVGTVRAVGGPDAVSPDVLSQAVTAAGQCQVDTGVALTFTPTCALEGDDFTVEATGLEPETDYTVFIQPRPSPVFEPGVLGTADEQGVLEVTGVFPEGTGIRRGDYTVTLTPEGSPDEVLARTHFVIAQVCIAEG